MMTYEIARPCVLLCITLVPYRFSASSIGYKILYTIINATLLILLPLKEIFNT